MNPISIDTYAALEDITAKLSELAKEGNGRHTVILGDPGLAKTVTMKKSLPWDSQIERVLDGQLALINPRIDLMDEIDGWLQMSDLEIMTLWWDSIAKWESIKAKTKEGEEPKVGMEEIMRPFYIALKDSCEYESEIEPALLRIQWRVEYTRAEKEVANLRKEMTYNHAWISGAGSYRGLIEAVYKYRNVDTLVFDDYDLSLKGNYLAAFNRIFASNDRRIVEHHTSSQHSKLTSLPKTFSVKFNAIVICNAFGRSDARLMATNPQQDAVYSRLQFFCFRPSPVDVWAYAKTWFTDKNVIKWVDKKFKEGEVINLDLRKLGDASHAWQKLKNEAYAIQILEAAIKPARLEYLTEDEEAVITWLNRRNKVRFTSGELAEATSRFRGRQNKDRLRATIANLVEMGRVMPLEKRSALETKGRPEGDLFKYLNEKESKEWLIKLQKSREAKLKAESKAKPKRASAK